MLFTRFYSRLIFAPIQKHAKTFLLQITSNILYEASLNTLEKQGISSLCEHKNNKCSAEQNV